MANVQKENGYTATANTLVEAICCLEVGGACHRVLRFIERKTYGYHKKEDAISLTQFEKGTGLHRTTIVESLDTLAVMNVILVSRNTYINMYKINKDFDTWTSREMPTSRQNQTSREMTQDSREMPTKTSREMPTYKRKKKYTKEISKTNVSQKNMAWKQYNENAHADDVPSIGDDGEIEKPKEKSKRHYKDVYKIFLNVFGKATPGNWLVNKTQMQCAENLYTERGVEQITKALQSYKEAKENLPDEVLEYLPQITSPYDLDSKWTKLNQFVKKHG